MSKTLPAGWTVYDRPTRGLAWRYFLWTPKPIPEQGWKIHVSVAADEVELLFGVITAIVVGQDVSFKVPTTIQGVTGLNFGEGGKSQIGKIVTIYPSTPEETASVAKLLDERCPYTRGPEVLSDVSLRPGGAVSVRYGALSNGPVRTDSIGRHAPAVRAPDGTLVDDFRDCPYDLPHWVPRLPIAIYQPPQADPLAELVVEGRRYLPTSVLASSPVSTVILALAIDSCKTVVLKTVRPGVGGDLRGFDASAKLASEFSVLRVLEDEEGLAPRPLGLKDGDVTVLVEEDIDGTTLDRLSQERQLANLPSLARAIGRLHRAGFVHRDVKLSNAMSRGATVTLLDFGLACEIGAPCPPLGGTGAYIPPEGSGTASTARDVYALGVCVAHTLLGRDPASLPRSGGRLVGLLHHVGLHEGAQLVRRFAAPRPTDRPSADVASVLLEHGYPALVRSLEAAATTDRARGTVSDRNWSKRAAVEAGYATRNFRNKDEHGECWRNEHFLADFACEGINLGAAGVILGLVSVDQAFGGSWFEDDLRLGAEWLATRVPSLGSGGLFTGDAGVALALAVTGRRLREHQLLEASRARLAAATETREVDLFCGAAGVVLAACLIAAIVEDDWPFQLVSGCAERLVESWVESHGMVVWPPSAALDSTAAPYTGAAHGTAGIAYALAMWGKRMRDRRALHLALKAFRTIDEAAWTDDRTTLKMRVGADAERAPVAGWCHGVTGYLWCLLQAFPDDRPLAGAVVRGIDAVVDSRVAIGDPTYCHGLAGLLEFWRMVGQRPGYETLARERAGGIVRSLRLMHDRADGMTVWCSDDPRVVTPDLWIGFLGPATAVALHASGHGYPLLSSQWLSRCARGQ